MSGPRPIRPLVMVPEEGAPLWFGILIWAAMITLFGVCVLGMFGAWD